MIHFCSMCKKSPSVVGQLRRKCMNRNAFSYRTDAFVCRACDEKMGGNGWRKWRYRTWTPK